MTLRRQISRYRYAIMLALVIGLLAVVVVDSRSGSAQDTATACRDVQQLLEDLVHEQPAESVDATERERFVAAATARIMGESADCFSERQRDDAFERLRALG